MRVLILGASGRTGSLALTNAIDKGYSITVLVRKTSSITPHSSVTVVEGSPLEEADIEAAFDKTPDDPVRAVIVALAASRASDSPFAKPLAPQWFIRDSVRNVRNQTQQRNINRIIVMSAFGSGSSWSNFPLIFKLLFRCSNMIHELRDHNAVEKELREAGLENGLEWTIAKPTLLKGEQTSLREFGETGKGVGMFDSCSRQGVALWLVDAVESRKCIGQACVLAN